MYYIWILFIIFPGTCIISRHLKTVISRRAARPNPSGQEFANGVSEFRWCPPCYVGGPGCPQSDGADIRIFILCAKLYPPEVGKIRAIGKMLIGPLTARKARYNCYQSGHAVSTHSELQSTMIVSQTADF